MERYDRIIFVIFTVTKLSEVTAGKGTMKRKQQIRELIEHHDKAEDDDDDFFSSTPMRTNKNAKVCTMLKKKIIIRNEFA